MLNSILSLKHFQGFPLNRKHWEVEVAVRYSQGKRILNLGAGHDESLARLAPISSFIIAYDLYGNNVWGHGEATNTFWENHYNYFPNSNIIPVMGDATTIPFGGKTFDYIYSLSSIEHFCPDWNNKTNITLALRECHRCLDDNGRLMLASEVSINGKGKPEVFESAWELIRLVEAAGFRLISEFDCSIADELLAAKPFDLYEHVTRGSSSPIPAHLTVQVQDCVFTSFSIVAEKL